MKKSFFCHFFFTLPLLYLPIISSSSLELDDSSFTSFFLSTSEASREEENKVKGDSDIWIIDFYAPWCEHCKRLDTELDIINQKENSGIEIVKVDGTVATATAQQHKVKHYPTILFYNRGKFHEYSGERTADSMLAYAGRIRAETPILHIHDETELQPLFDDHEIVFLLSFPTGYQSPNWKSILEQFYAVANDLKLSCSFAQIESPSIPFPSLKKMESRRISLLFEISETTAPSEIVEFTEKHNHMLLTPLDRGNFRRLGRTGKPLIIAITNPIQDEDGSAEMIQALDDAVAGIEQAEHISPETLHNYIFGHMDGLRYRMFLSRYRATPPSILVIDLSSDHTPNEAGGGGYFVEYDVSEESIRNVVQKTILGELYFKEVPSLDQTFFGRIEKKIKDYYPWSLLCLFPVFMICVTIFVPNPDDKWKKD